MFNSRRLPVSYLTKTLTISAVALIYSSSALAGNGPHAPSLVPSNPTPGECYVRVKIPAQYSKTTEQIITQDSYSKIEVRDPVLQSREEQVLVKEASIRFKVRQPVFRTQSERIITRPSYDKLTVSPPQFSTVTETIQTSSPRLIWKRGNPGDLAKQGYIIHSTADGGYRGQGYSSTTQYGQSGGTQCGSACEIWCLVEEPGESVSYNRRVMTAPSRVHRVPVPAQYRTIQKQVVSDPGGVEEIFVPAEYRGIRVEDIIDPGGEKSVHVPEQYGAVDRKTLIAPERYEWRRAICAPGTGGTVQKSGHQSGYHSGSNHSGVPSSGTVTRPGSSYQSRTYGSIAAPATRSRETIYYKETGAQTKHTCDSSRRGACRH